MRKIMLVMFLSTLIFYSAFTDCADDIYYEPSEANYIDFMLHGRNILRATPQKITKTLQGITFTSDYDNGSLQDVEEVETNVFNCTIYVESGTLGKAQYWFRFKMTGVAGKSITLNITHPQNRCTVISFDGINWRRMTDAEAPDTNVLYLSFTAEQNFAELAFFYPLGYKETFDRVSDMIKKSDCATTESIGKSYQGRDMWMITINDKSFPDTQKHRVWVHSRAHAGEATAVHAMLGMLEQALETSDNGERLRRYCIFNIIPIENVDGVYLGHTRWDSQGFDPERDWCDPTTIPEVLNLRKQVEKIMASDNQIEVALNLHSTTGTFSDTFFFKHLYPSVTYAFEAKQQSYIDAVNHATPLFDNLYKGTSQLAACIFIESFFWNNWKEQVMAMTYEGHFQKRITDGNWITSDDYRQIGKAMSAGLIEYFNIPELPKNPNYWMIY